MPDDFPADISTTGTLAPGATLTGNIDTAGDVDWIALNAAENTGHSITVTATGSGGQSATPEFRLWRDGAYFDYVYGYSSTAGRAALPYWTLDSGQTYLEVSYADATQTGTYDIAFQVNDDHPSSADGTVLAIDPGTNLTGTISGYNDSDYFELNVTAGASYLIDIAPADSALSLVIANLVGDFSGYISGYYYENSAPDIFTANQTGTLGLTIIPPAAGEGDYTISLTEVEGDLASDTATTGVIAPGETVAGRIDFPADQDWFAVDLVAGKTYSYSVTMESQNPNYGFYPAALALYDNAGNFVSNSYQEQPYELTAQVLTILTSGRYYLSVESVYYQYTYDYDLTLLELTDDYSGSDLSDGSISLDNPQTATVDFDRDDDWFSFDASAGAIYRVDAVAASDFEGTLSVGLGGNRHYGENGTTFRATQDGAVWLSVIGNNGTGDYSLSVTEVYVPTAQELASLPAEGANIVEFYGGIAAGTSGADVIQSDHPDAIVTFRGGGGADTLIGGGSNDLLIGDDGMALTSDVLLMAQAHRAYMFMFGRTVDQTGLQALLGDHSYRYFDSYSLYYSGSTLAAQLAGSQEFANLYGSDLTNAEFVDILYTRMRGPGGADNDPGAADWVSYLDSSYYNGRAEVLRAFFDSQEWQNQLGGGDYAFALENGPARHSADVFAMYQAVLGRDPDAFGFADWALSMANGVSLSSLAEKFLGSAEFAQNDTQSDRAFAELILTNLYGSAPTGAELDQAEAYLTAGVDRADWVTAQALLDTTTDPTAWVQAQGRDDVLIAGAGNNTLYGGLWVDTFVFTPDDIGNQHIGDFEIWDLIDLRSFGYADADQALALFQMQGASTIFADAGVTIVLDGFDATDLTAANLWIA